MYQKFKGLNNKHLATTNQKHIIDTQKQREINPNIELKIVIRSQGKWEREEYRNKEEWQNNQKAINMWSLSTSINNYVKCKLIKGSI